jgi:hypothetical protein
MLDEPRRSDDPPRVSSPGRDRRSDGASFTANLLVGATVVLLLVGFVVLLLVR